MNDQGQGLGSAMMDAILDADCPDFGEEFVPRDPKAPYIGLFSSKAASLYGTAFYFTPDGREVEITAVCREGQEEEYKWPDWINVGLVARRSRDGRKGSSMLELAYTTEEIKQKINEMEKTLGEYLI